MFALLLFACTPDTGDKPDPGTPVGALSPDDPALGTWDGQVYLIRSGAMDDGDEPGQWAPYAVGEVYETPVTWPIGGGLPDMGEGCVYADTLPLTLPGLVDVGDTLPLVVGPRTFQLEHEPDWGDYWWSFLTDLACDCDVGTAVSLPDTDGEVAVPDPVVLDGFDAAWATFEETGTLDLRWVAGGEDTRVQFWVDYDGVGAGCILDDDGAARLALPRGDVEPNVHVSRTASRAIAHPTYGTVQLSVMDVFFPLVESP